MATLQSASTLFGKLFYPSLYTYVQLDTLQRSHWGQFWGQSTDIYVYLEKY